MSRLACFALAALLAQVAAYRNVSVCLKSYCDCTPAEENPSWTDVRCDLPMDQRLNIKEGDLPTSTSNLLVEGGEAVMLLPNSLSRLRDPRLISFNGTKIVLFRSLAGVDIDIVHMYLDVQNCDILRFEEMSFNNLRGPMSVIINNCDEVSIEGLAFSWILAFSVVNVGNLNLHPAAFMLSPTAINVGPHGPGLMISLTNSTSSEFPGQTFGSSAAIVRLEDLHVRAIRANAFSANTYNAVVAINCSFHLIESEAFAHTSFIDNLYFHGCKIHQFETKALQSAATTMNITHTRIDKFKAGSINGTLASVLLQDCEFHKIEERSIDLSLSNKLVLERNSFDFLPANAIVAASTMMHEFVFNENEIETAEPGSLAFVGQAFRFSDGSLKYEDNYFGQPCHCNLTQWFSDVINYDATDDFLNQSYCTVNEFFARCFNVPEQNMKIKKFLESVCDHDITIKCEPFKTKAEGATTEIKNPRFPHKGLQEEGLNERDKKVICIVIVTVFFCIIFVSCFSLVKWMRRKGYCINFKNLIMTSNFSCGIICDSMCSCRRNNSRDNVTSTSPLSVQDFTETHCLNEPRVQDAIQETTFLEMYMEPPVPTEDKTTQTLPEELTKELLQNLKEKLEDPENYAEAREMIEHLYELIKVGETCNDNLQINPTEENIYELPFINTAPRIGKNKKQMISIGTRAPSLDKLLPISPYNRQTALAHEYFEPKDFAVHLYAEIANSDKERKTLLGAIPDVVTEEIVPRGPYLKAVRDKNTSPLNKPQTTSLFGSHFQAGSPQSMSSITSKKSNASDSSGKMLNRPLPKKPITDQGAGPSSVNRE